MMTRYLLAFLAITVASAAEQASPTCEAGDSQCTSGVLLLQKKAIHKKVTHGEKGHAEAGHKKAAHATGAHAEGEKKVMVSETDLHPGMGGGSVSFSARHGEIVLGKYPGYTGRLDITGSVNMSAAMGSVTLSWTFSGVEDICSSTDQASRRLMNTEKPNACGLHIHTGTTCTDATKVGGHLWQKPKGTSPEPKDPWANVVYVTNQGMSIGSTSLRIGTEMDDLDGKAFVVHDASGGRVACGLIKDTSPNRGGNGGKSGAAGLGSVLVALLSVVVMPHWAA